MAKENRPPFDSFLFGNRPSSPQKAESSETPKTDWPALLHEVNKTWDSISPMVKPLLDKFKK
ncbi:hypothetical protein MUN89_16180 [Halobacillus salinarum]|uniref:Uncharacterized protein n=1 Tax=Halobacillus salinarum TaxID=2932257 RepID=A0ABY4EH19_9BACI|nr:hypothetical protein [Halobacillus salinarum]UOQ43444.1 hypothetical protein MUN89_16180 [Halobacillus salinarum]